MKIRAKMAKGNRARKKQAGIEYLLWTYNDDPIDKSQDSNYIVRGRLTGDWSPALFHKEHSLNTIAEHEEIL
jgi:hypothetical protein